MHGGTGGAPKGDRNGRWRHGRYSAAHLAERREVVALIREMRRQMKAVGA
jgi:hypothetical protein